MNNWESTAGEKGNRMKIATFINDSGEVAGFYEKGKLCRCEKIAGQWEITREVPLDITSEMGLLETKELFFAAMTQLEDCRVFIVKKFKGLFHALLMEELGFHTWISEGSTSEQLDNVVLLETEYVAQLEKQALLDAAKPPVKSSGHGGCGGGCSPGRRPAPAGAAEPSAPRSDIPAPAPVGDPQLGHYLINLSGILAGNPALNSREVLIPHLEGNSFQKLEIICDHIPRWFYNELRNLKLKAGPEVPDAAGLVTVIVEPERSRA
jgi:Fe-only nitrogenase accessory protein AnfO